MNILAIGAHPDDIEFGCGGTLVKYAKRGKNVCLLIMTEGEVGGKFKVRKKEQEGAAKILGAERVFWGGFVDTEIPANRALISNIEDVIHEVKPNLILVNYFKDTHQDHRRVADSTVSATRYIKNVLFYEVPTTLSFEPDIFVDIGDALNEKMRLLKAHKSQVFETRIAGLSILESAASCANFRGYQGRVKYAEGFMSLRLLMDI